MEWKQSHGLIAYPEALATMAARVEAIQRGDAEELVWFVEHPPLYTAGTSAKGADLLGDNGFPVYETGRGGQYTYHGPGQRVVYLMLDLNKRGKDVRAYVQQLEQWIIATLAQFGIEGFIREGRVGVWVEERVASGEWGVGSEEATRHSSPAQVAAESCVAEGEPRSGSGQRPTGAKEGKALLQESKIAALGVRVQKWVTSHGIALNVNPDLSHYAGIVPCGIRELGVTSMHALGVKVSMEEVDARLRENFTRVFNSP